MSRNPDDEMRPVTNRKELEEVLTKSKIIFVQWGTYFVVFLAGALLLLFVVFIGTFLWFVTFPSGVNQKCITCIIKNGVEYCSPCRENAILCMKEIFIAVSGWLVSIIYIVKGFLIKKSTHASDDD